MKSIIFVLFLLLNTKYVFSGDQCDFLKNSEIHILKDSSFNVNYSNLLDGCFTGYLPVGMRMEEGLFRFGIFRDGKLITSLPIVEAGMDLSSDPHSELRIRSVSFKDIDKDGRRDVLVIGENLVANGVGVFVQLYWACKDKFIFDESTNDEIIDLTIDGDAVNVASVTSFVRKKKLKSNMCR